MQAWDQFLDHLSGMFGRSTVDKWVRSLTIVRFDACNLYLKAKDSFQVDWIQEHVVPVAHQVFKNNNGHTIKLHISSPDESPVKRPDRYQGKDQDLKFDPDPLLTHCTFEQYVPASINHIPYGVLCKLVGFNPTTQMYEDPPSDKFNPIYIYGPQGIGKTHLLMATATFLQLSGQKVFYAGAETFTSHVVSAIRNGKMQQFRAAYRNVDVLIIDDVEVLGRKNATQEELFHTFNTLHTSGKQIILSGHVNPRLLEYVADRLISRFEWGITLPLEKGEETTDLEVILRKRSQYFGIRLKKGLADYLLKNFTSPASLSRALENMASSCQQTQAIQELSHVEPLLTKLIHQESIDSINPEKILGAVAEAFGIKTQDILSSSQAREATLPRQISMYLMRRELKLPYMKIGDIFHRDHSTVMSSIKLIKRAIQDPDSEVNFYLNQLRNFFSSHSKPNSSL